MQRLEGAGFDLAKGRSCWASVNATYAGEARRGGSGTWRDGWSMRGETGRLALAGREVADAGSSS